MLNKFWQYDLVQKLLLVYILNVAKVEAYINRLNTKPYTSIVLAKDHQKLYSDSIVKFAKNTCINIFVLLCNLAQSQSCKCITIFQAISILATKIIIFEITIIGVIEVIRWSNFLKPAFIIEINQYNNSVYN